MRTKNQSLTDTEHQLHAKENPSRMHTCHRYSVKTKVYILRCHHAGEPLSHLLIFFHGQTLIPHLDDPLVVIVDTPAQFRARLLPHGWAESHVDEIELP